MSEATKLPGSYDDDIAGEQLPDGDVNPLAFGQQPAISGELVRPPAGVLDVPFSQQIERLLAPYTIDLTEWVSALLGVTEFEGLDAEQASLGMLAQILQAATSDDALAGMELDKAKAMCGGEPGGHSPLLEIRGARPLKSDFDEGPSVYCIVDAVYVASGEPVRFAVGARAVQAAIIAHIGNGWMPFQAILTIRSQKTRAGFYPLNLEAGG